MKWTRITKESLPPIDDYEDYPKKYLVRVKGDDPRSGWVSVKYETAAEMQDLLQEDYAEYLGESPESTVWPGVGLLEEIQLRKEVYEKVLREKMWPESRTAPDQPEQFSREDMWKVAAIGDLDSQWFEKWITEYIKNKK